MRMCRKEHWRCLMNFIKTFFMPEKHLKYPVVLRRDVASQCHNNRKCAKCYIILGFICEIAATFQGLVRSNLINSYRTATVLITGLFVFYVLSRKRWFYFRLTFVIRLVNENQKCN